MRIMQQFESFDGQLYNLERNCLEADIQWLINRLRIVRAQEEGCGGNLTPPEVLSSMQEMLDDTLRIVAAHSAAAKAAAGLPTKGNAQ